MSWPAKLSFNDMVASPRALDEVLEAGAQVGLTGVGLHIHLVEEFGFKRTLELIRRFGVTVTMYSAVGFWASGVDYRGRPKRLADVLRNLDEAVELGTDVVGITAGRPADGDNDLESARARVIAGIAELVPHARERNLKLAIEPVHPIFGGGGLLIPTLRYAIDIIDAVGGDSALGILLDTYHLWWEPDLPALLRRAAKRVFIVQVSDWSPELVAQNPRWRAALGEGCIDFQVYLQNLPDYDGWFDSEVVNDERNPGMSLPALLDQAARTSREVLGARLD